MSYPPRPNSNRMRVLKLISENHSPQLEFRKKILAIFVDKRSAGYTLNDLQKQGLIQYRWIVTNAGQQMLHKLANQEWKERQNETRCISV